MSRHVRRIKDPLLERYLAGDLDAAAKARVEELLRESEADQQRLAELRADSQAFLTQHPPGQMIARFERERARALRWRLPALLAPFAAAAALLLLFIEPPSGGDRGEPEFTPKGLALVIHKKQGDSSARVEPGTVLRPGDAVRFEVKAGRRGFVAVLGRDGGGEVTVYYPYGGAESAAYEPGAPLLPTAIELDASSGREQVYAIFGDQPFALPPIVERLRSGATIEQAAPGLELGRAELNKP